MLGFVRHETVILKVVARLMNPTLGCKELKKCSETCLVLSVILFIQLCQLLGHVPPVKYCELDH